MTIQRRYCTENHSCYLLSSLTSIIIIVAAATVATTTIYAAASAAAVNSENYQTDPEIISEPPSRCQPVATDLCRIPHYSTFQTFNNTLGHKSMDDAIAEFHKYAFLFESQPCSDYIQPFLCPLYLPVCITTTQDMILPCRNGCELARKSCEPILKKSGYLWQPEWDCNKFPELIHNPICFHKEEETPASFSTGVSNNIIKSNKIVPPLVESSHIFPPNDFMPDSHANSTVCPNDMFDCRLSHPDASGMKALCIETKFVCDGKKDCVSNDEDVPGDGLDEKNCQQRCSDGQLYCEGRCVAVSDICNGVADCSSGIDEQDCYDYMTGLVQSILCIFALFTAIYLLVRFFRIDDEIEKSTRYDPVHKIQEEERHPCQPYDVATPPDLTRAFNSKPCYTTVHPKANIQYPIYEQTDISSIYERTNDGGYSGFSSEYNSYAFHSPCMFVQKNDDSKADLKELKEPPAAPPPTPAPQSIYLYDEIQRPLDM